MRKEQKTEQTKKHKFLKVLIVTFIVIVILAVVAFFISFFKWKSLAAPMVNNINSEVLDTDGNTIAYIGSERIQENVDFNDIPKDLVNAYIAIEDERYYKHSGVDIKRTTAAIASYIIHLGHSNFGGSTITQQLVKNMTGENSTSVPRKVKEWIKATQLELFLSKDEILEVYFNIIYTGPNIYGVQDAAKYYFSKDVKDLSLAESAYLAGINISPNSFNPFCEKDNSEKIVKRVKTVLDKMEDLGYITEDQYNSAAKEAEDLKFKQTKLEPKESTVYSYHSDAAISEIISDFSKKKMISESFATNYLIMSGSKIQSTQDSSLQTAVETEFKKSQHILKSKKDPTATSQAAMVIMDHSTGKVLACSGGLGEKKNSRGFNRATNALRQTGSAGKPISVLVPAFCTKKVTAASVFVDIETTFDDGTPEGYTPTDYNGFKGAITLRRAVESSQNIPFVKIMEKITPSTSIRYMKRMGITTLTKLDNNLNLALGGLDKGISPLEMSGAYATIANDGVYIEPTFYEDIKDSSGNIILKSKQKHRRVFSSNVAYILKELLTQPVKGTYGTATYCKIQGIETAAKTGTTNENYDRWLCGFTPYYTAVTWYGFDMNETINYGGNNPAGVIWANVMKKIHTNLKNKDFEKPLGIESAKICPKSGKVANPRCSNSYTEYFIHGTVPETCNMH